MGWARSAIFAAAAMLATPVMAQTIYDNGAPSGADGRTISGYQVADDFTLANDASIGGASFYLLSSANPFVNPLNYFLYAGDAPNAVTLIASGTAQDVTLAATGATPFGLQESLVSFLFETPFSIDAGTRYWLGLNSDAANGFWETTGPNDTAFVRQSTGPATYPTQVFAVQEAFSLQAAAAVPEPASWAMMILGIGITGGMLRFRRRGRTDFA